MATLQPRGTSRILVVDDEPMICRMLMAMLGGEGYETAFVEDGAAALSLLQQIPTPQVVLLDLMMPGMTGMEVLRAVRAQAERSERVHIIMYSATSDAETIAATAAAGADGYVVKGWGWERLRDEVRKFFPAKAAPQCDAA